MRRNGYLETLIKTQSEAGGLVFRNLGWSGENTSFQTRPANFASEDEWLAQQKTDLIIAGYGMAQSFNGAGEVETFKDELAAKIEHWKNQSYNGEGPVRVALLSPIAFEDIGELTPNHKERNRELKLYRDAIEAVALEKDVPFIDLYTPTHELMNEKGGQQMTTNGLHLNPYGYWAASKVMANAMLGDDAPWNLELDAAAMKGIEKGGVLKLDSVQTRLPGPPAPGRGPVHDGLKEGMDRIAIRNLPVGIYQLELDGERVGEELDHKTWANGVAINDSPLHQRSEKLRSRINDKNAQFMFSYRALNQVHIVGSRKKSPAGLMLPAEIVEIAKIVDAEEAQLAAAFQPQDSGQWRLIRVK